VLALSCSVQSRRWLGYAILGSSQGVSIGCYLDTHTLQTAATRQLTNQLLNSALESRQAMKAGQFRRRGSVSSLL